MMETKNKMFNIRTGRRIMQLRLQRTYTREALAELADISSGFLYEIEVGKKHCSSFVLYRIAASLGVQTNVLLEDETDIDKYDSKMIYTGLEESQKEKIDSIMRIIYRMLHEVQ